MALSPIVAQALASREAPDIAGSFQRGQEQQQVAKDRTRQEQARALSGQAFESLGIGGAIGELGAVDPGLAFQMMDAVGIPRDQPGRLKKLAQESRTALELEKGTPGRGLQFLQEVISQNKAAGIDTTNLEQAAAQLEVNPKLGLSTLNAVVKSFVAADILQPSALDIAARKATVEGKQVEQKQVNALRKDITGIKKSFNLVEEAKNRIDKIGSKGTAASDLALIFNFMKMLDPGSTVREGEFATAQNATGVQGRIVSLYNNLLEGTRLNPDQRVDFLSRVDDLFEGQQKATDDQVGRILDQGVEDQIEGKRILGGKAFSAFQARRQAQQPTVQETTTVSPQGAQQTTTVAGQPQEGSTATNPQTGQVAEFRNGQWEIK